MHSWLESFLPAAKRRHGQTLHSDLDSVVTKVGRLARHFVAPHFPSGLSQHLRYSVVTNTDWTPGFWTGLLWLVYAYTGLRRYRRQAEAYLSSFRERLAYGGAGVQTHDLGFLYTLSCVAAYTLTGCLEAQAIALWAADLLTRRYLARAHIIQAWGQLDDPEQQGRIIIDSTMNMPLLFWASGQTGNRTHACIAAQHLRQVARYLVRADGSTLHTCYIDPHTGVGIRGQTHQGFSDDSCWSRGQAWGIYGFALAYHYTHEAAFHTLAKTLADYFLGRLPADGICYWDCIFEAGADEEKDSSAAAIAAAGLLALSQLLPTDDVDRPRYHHAACQILATLTMDYVSMAPHVDGLLLHGVGHRPAQYGIDECCLWGDYFYMECLMRLHTAWTPYW